MGAVLCIPAVLAAESLGIEGGWGMTGIAVVVQLIASLVDREGFYGPRES